jgi:hypothetical protein
MQTVIISFVVVFALILVLLSPQELSRPSTSYKGSYQWFYLADRI